MVTFITLILHLRQIVTLGELGFKIKKPSFKVCAVFLCIQFLIVTFCEFILLKTKRLLLLDKLDLSNKVFTNLPEENN